MKLGEGREFRAIQDFVARAASRPASGGGDSTVLLGPGDDAALVEGGSGVLVLSCDSSVEGVHFRRDWISLEEIGFRAVAAALSDLAAMGAAPVGILLGLHLPRGGEAGLGELASGVGEACATWEARLLGGDLVSTPGPLALDVTVVGRSHAPVLRSGAHPGEGVFVTGSLGGSGGAVRLWQRGAEPSPRLRERYARPRARIQEGLWLARQGVPTALLDLSDGMAGDLGHLSAAGGVAVIVEAANLPLDPGLAPAGFTPHEARGLALTAGEDFELAFTAPAARVEEIQEAFEATFGLGITRVGRVEEGSGVWWVPEDGGARAPLPGGGFDHLGERGKTT